MNWIPIVNNNNVVQQMNMNMQQLSDKGDMSIVPIVTIVIVIFVILVIMIRLINK